MIDETVICIIVVTIMDPALFLHNASKYYGYRQRLKVVNYYVRLEKCHHQGKVKFA